MRIWGFPSTALPLAGSDLTLRFPSQQDCRAAAFGLGWNSSLWQEVPRGSKREA